MHYNFAMSESGAMVTLASAQALMDAEQKEAMGSGIIVETTSIFQPNSETNTDARLAARR